MEGILKSRYGLRFSKAAEPYKQPLGQGTSLRHSLVPGKGVHFNCSDTDLSDKDHIVIIIYRFRDFFHLASV